MAKRVYLLMSDLHLMPKKRHRVNYLGEVLDSMMDILTLNEKYKSEGYETAIISMGDMVDSTISDSENSMLLLNALQFYFSQFDYAFTLIGNHEITYRKSNPFWYLMTSIQDEQVSQMQLPVQPKGLKDYVTIPDQITDGEVHFIFNHYVVPARAPEKDGINIGLFHQNVGSNEICKMWGTFDSPESASYIQAYDYCFFGHMHMATGVYDVNGVTCEWLNAIGRTNYREITPELKYVNIPAIIVEDGKFIRKEDNPITLKPYEECVLEKEVNQYQAAAALAKERAQARATVYKMDSLYDSILMATASASCKELLRLLSQTEDEMFMEYERDLLNRDFTEEDFKPADDLDGYSEGADDDDDDLADAVYVKKEEVTENADDDYLVQLQQIHDFVNAQV